MKKNILNFLCIAFISVSMLIAKAKAQGYEIFDQLLQPINVLGETFELVEAVGSLRTDKSNTYRTQVNESNTKFYKIVYVDEFIAKKKRNKTDIANAHLKQLKYDGEDAKIYDVSDKDFIVIYSINSNEIPNYKILSVSKFYDNTPKTILHNQYSIVLNAKEANAKRIEQIVNEFIDSNKIDIRHIRIKKTSYNTEYSIY